MNVISVQMALNARVRFSCIFHGCIGVGYFHVHPTCDPSCFQNHYCFFGSRSPEFSRLKMHKRFVFGRKFKKELPQGLLEDRRTGEADEWNVELSTLGHMLTRDDGLTCESPGKKSLYHQLGF